MSEKQAVSVACKACGIRWMKRKDTLARWSGWCNRCSQKMSAWTPERRQRQREMARAQVTRQGGIPNARQFTTENVGGAAHWNWRDGIYAARLALYSSSAYKEWRAAVFHRDDFTCGACEKRGGHLHAHHVIPVSVDKTRALDVDNGKTLCASCHALTHKQMALTRPEQRSEEMVNV
jgi:hypothetical protein